jgi:hypothetical protein
LPFVPGATGTLGTGFAIPAVASALVIGWLFIVCFWLRGLFALKEFAYQTNTFGLATVLVHGN